MCHTEICNASVGSPLQMMTHMSHAWLGNAHGHPMEKTVLSGSVEDQLSLY